jgi:hypothetical protein
MPLRRPPRLHTHTYGWTNFAVIADEGSVNEGDAS